MTYPHKRSAWPVVIEAFDERPGYGESVIVYQAPVLETAPTSFHSPIPSTQRILMQAVPPSNSWYRLNPLLRTRRKPCTLLDDGWLVQRPEQNSFY